MQKELKFEVVSKLGKKIRITKEYWEIIITVKHPSIKKYEGKIKDTLIEPEEIRKSVTDDTVYLYYKKFDNKYYICVVAKHLDGQGFIITTYLTDTLKVGDIVWKK